MSLARCALGAACGAAVLIATAGAGSAVEDESLYRDDMPAVLAPSDGEQPRADGGAAVVSAFAEAYRDAGSPPIAVFWDRAFDDRLDGFQADARLVFSWKGAARAEGDHGVSDMAGSERAVLSVERAVDDEPRSPLGGPSRMAFETGFARAFLRAGAMLVDRAAVMRLTHAARADDDTESASVNRQLIETEALRTYADMIVQVLATWSEASDLGVAFQVSVLDLKSGALRATLFNDGTFEGETEWAAAKGGYVRVTGERRVGFEEMGRILALQTMEALLVDWQ